MKKIRVVGLRSVQILLALFFISLLPSYLCATPPQLTDFYPSEGTIDVPLTPLPTLSWTGTDPDPGDTLTYDVYFGTSQPPPLVISNQAANSYQTSQVSHYTTYYWKIVARDNNGEVTEGSVLSFRTLDSPPQITSFSPADGATGVSMSLKLNWNASDPDPGDTLTYDIYFGISSPPTLVLSNQTNSYYYPIALNHFTTYYWKVIARDPHGAIAELPILSFTTLSRLPKFSSFSPPNGSAGISITPTLSWVATDADPDDTLTYDIYFGVTSPPPIKLSNQTITSYQPGQLAYSTRYYWKIVAHDPHGAEGTIEAYFDTISTDIKVDHSPSSVSRPQICADGSGYVYAVWEDSRNGSSDIYFNYSSDYGATWQTADIRLDTNTPGISSSNYPQIACDNSGHVYVVWEDERNGSADIYFNYSTDHGKSVTWLSSDKKLSTASYAPPPQYPRIACDNSGHVYVAWDDNYFNTCSNYGADCLTQAKRISTSGGIGTQLSCDQIGHVYLAWRTSDVFFNHSTDYGNTWQTIDEIISNTNSIPYGLSLTNDGSGHVYCVWHDGRNSTDNPDVYFNSSPDNGNTWEVSDVRLNMATPGTTFSIWPEIACDQSGHLYVAWYDRRNGFGDIYLNYSSDYGANWESLDKRLETDSPGAADSGFPVIASDGRGHVYAIWADDQEGVGFGLYINSSLDNGANWQAQNIKVGTGGFYPQLVADSTRLYIIKDNNDILFNKLAPLVPAVPSPIDGAAQIGLTQTLSWQGGDLNLDNLLTYDVYFGTSSPPPLASANQKETSYVPSALNYLTSYYWQVVSKDSSGVETPSPIWSFSTMSAPPQFIDFLPPDGSTDVSLTATLSWTATDPDVGDTLVYDIYLSKGNPPPMLYKSNSSSNSIDLELAHYSVYYWQIVARDSHGTETRGPVLSFTTLNNPPVFNDTAFSPSNEATGVFLKPTLKWAASDPNYGDPLNFDIYFGTTSPPPLVASNLTNMNYQPGQLDHFTTYYWKVVVRDHHNAETEGAILSFTTRNHVPKFTSALPEGGAKGVSLTPTLIWTATDLDPDDTLVYDIYFGTSTQPTLMLSNQTVTSYQPGQLSNSTLYYWMIVARDPHGAETSMLKTFTTVSAPPQFDQSKFSPVNGATGVSTKPVLSWSATDPEGDTITYGIYIYSDTASPPLLEVSNYANSTYQPTITLQVLTTYYWKIVARDSNGIETAGPILTFTTGDSPPVFQSFSPADRSTYVSAMTKLSWSATDPDPGDTITYDVYFGTISSPPKVVDTSTSMTYQPGTLQPLTTYYWKIVARDNHGFETVSPVLSFTTRESVLPVINSVYPNPCKPLQTITIIGLNFGDSQGNSIIHLGAKIFGPGNKKIVKWSDTRIDLIIPAFGAWPSGVTRTRDLWVSVNGIDSNPHIKLKIYKP